MIHTVNITFETVLQELDAHKADLRFTLAIPSVKEVILKTPSMKVHVVGDFVRATKFDSHTLFTYVGAGGFDIFERYVESRGM